MLERLLTLASQGNAALEAGQRLFEGDIAGFKRLDQALELGHGVLELSQSGLGLGHGLGLGLGRGLRFLGHGHRSVCALR